MKSTIIFFLAIFLIKLVSVQAQIKSSQTSPNIEFDKLKQPTPKVKAMQHFGEYSVSLNTGMPNIVIPLYEIQSGSLKLPISMRFTPTGRKVDEKSETLGFGWKLECGGKVTRTKRGLCDENDTYSFLPYSALSLTQLDTDYRVGYCYNQMDDADNYYRYLTRGILVSITDQLKIKKYLLDGDGDKGYDSQYDIFSYTLPSGKSGKFILIDTIIDGNKTKKTFTIPYTGVKVEIISYMELHNEEFIGKLKITDTDGTVYYFGNYANSTTNYQVETNEPFYVNYSLTQPSNIIPKYSWLDETDADLQSFCVNGWSLCEMISADKYDTIKLSNSNVIYNNIHSNGNTYNFVSYSLSDKILCENGYFATNTAKSKFDLEKNLQNSLSGSNYTKSFFEGAVFNQGNVLFDSNNLVVNNKSGDLIKKITFHYSTFLNEIKPTLDYILIVDNNNTIAEKYIFDYYRGTVSSNEFSKDWWGYYNGSNNPLSPPFKNTQFRKSDHTDDTYNFPILSNSIINKGVDTDIQKIGMIKSITYPTGGTTTFNYGSNFYLNSENTIVKGPGLRIESIVNNNAGIVTTKQYTYSAGLLPQVYEPLTDNFTQEIYTRTIVDMPDDNIDFFDSRLRTFCSDFVVENAGFSAPVVYYTNVTEQFIVNGTNMGRTEYDFSEPYRNIKTYSYIYPSERIWGCDNYSISLKQKYFDDSYCWKGGKLVEKREYSPTNIVRRTTYKYSDHVVERRMELNAKKFFQFADNTENSSHKVYWEEEYFGNKGFCFARKEYLSGDEKLVQERVETDGVLQVTDYEYDENLQIIKEKRWDSKTIETYNVETDSYQTNGKNYQWIYKYPYNFNTEPYIEMVKRNIQTQVIEKAEYRNDTEFLNSTIIEFYNWTVYPFAKKNIFYRTNKQTEAVARISYEKYDCYGNPAYIISNGDEKVVYIWMYKGMYPTAEIKNATFTEVENVVKTIFSVADINALSAMTLPDEAKLKDGSLQTALPNALVTTFTYKPLIGISTVTDPRGVTTYYEYDSFNRLKYIRDKDNKILQSFDYNYKQQ